VSGTPGRLVLLGHPLGHTLSPVFQNAALRSAGIALAYEPVDVARTGLPGVLEELRRGRWAGNVTIPYKGDVAAECDRLSDTATRIGAVNTFWCAVDGALVGDNTDVEGFDAAARSLLGAPRPGLNVGVIGAGGGAAAVLHAIERWQPSVAQVYSRSRDRTRSLVDRFPAARAIVASSAVDAVQGADLVVNATPIGLSDDGLPVPAAALASSAAVIDLAYRRGGTPFVRAAQARGLRAQDGLTMLLEQGALAFERWFSVKPDREAMWKALEASR